MNRRERAHDLLTDGLVGRARRRASFAHTTLTYRCAKVSIKQVVAEAGHWSGDAVLLCYLPPYIVCGRQSRELSVNFGDSFKCALTLSSDKMLSQKSPRISLCELRPQSKLLSLRMNYKLKDETYESYSSIRGCNDHHKFVWTIFRVG